jgi:hypothetical protein
MAKSTKKADVVTPLPPTQEPALLGPEGWKAIGNLIDFIKAGLNISRDEEDAAPLTDEETESIKDLNENYWGTNDALSEWCLFLGYHDLARECSTASEKKDFGAARVRAIKVAKRFNLIPQPHEHARNRKLDLTEQELANGLRLLNNDLQYSDFDRYYSPRKYQSRDLLEPKDAHELAQGLDRQDIADLIACLIPTTTRLQAFGRHYTIPRCFDLLGVSNDVEPGNVPSPEKSDLHQSQMASATAQLSEKSVNPSTPAREHKWRQNVREVYGRQEGQPETQKWIEVSKIVIKSATEESKKHVRDRHCDYLTPLMLKRLIAKLTAPGISLKDLQTKYAEYLRRRVTDKHPKTTKSKR